MSLMMTEEFIEKCRKNKLSITPQRVAIYENLRSTQSHPTAEEVYEELKAKIPALSLGTVYKTLETFEAQGFVTKTRPTGEKARYDANVEPHHHLVCRVCGKIEDIHEPSLNRISLPLQVKKRFQVEDYKIVFHGICKECSA